MFDEAADKAMNAIVEKFIDVDYMVEVQVFRLHKREVVAAGGRLSRSHGSEVGGWERGARSREPAVVWGVRRRA